MFKKVLLINLEHLRADQLGTLLKVSKRNIYRTAEKVKVRGKTRFMVPLTVRELEEGEELLRPTIVAAFLKLHRSTIYRYIDDGVLESVKIGKRSVRILKSSLDKLLVAHSDILAT